MRINSLTIGSFTATANDADIGSGGNNLKQLEGLASPTRRVPQFDLPSTHGAFVSNALYGSRPITFVVELLGSSESDYQTRARSLLDELDLVSNPEKTVTIVDAQGVSYYVMAYPNLVQGGEEPRQRNFGRFTVQLVAEDYRIYAATENSTTISLRDTSGGLTIPTTVPLSFGSGSGGSKTLTNDGQVITHPTVKLKNTLTNPTIRNVTTGKSFQYSASIASGDYVEIDMLNKTVTDQSGNDVLSSVNPNLRDFWALQAGDNEVSFIHEGSYNANAEAVITWNDAYIIV